MPIQQLRTVVSAARRAARASISLTYTRERLIRSGHMLTAELIARWQRRGRMA